ncbi:hypothetical protein NDN01_25375 [Sphingomonas sp. QA11]|uniref:hypothetical protein n=1 Tax=Sphingomonas sp. QA11 TaxID=2950605 RepID=UPI00234AFD1C|nr:hypothetical protein [Sphingomonas sp. QA11]WCM27273.1 hypothetical protein NDN01_25375 [Sphingomonas sp. QA11]
MADADSIVRWLHPAVVRQAGFAAWTADPAIATLFAILRDLDKAGARLEALQHDRPDLGADAARGDIGGVVSLYERCPAHFFGHGWRTRANGGACAGLWELLAARRDAWIDARLEAEGFRLDAASVEKDERTMALGDEAIPVELAWTRFQAG